MKETLQLREGEDRILFGPRDRTLRITRESFGVNVYARGEELVVEGDDAAVSAALHAFAEMLGRIRSRGELEEGEVFEIIREGRAQLEAGGEDVSGGPERRGSERRGSTRRGGGLAEDEESPALDPHFKVTPRTAGQRSYIEAIKNHDVVFAVGPAGTGKTYLAVALAISALRKNLFRRMVLARPAVEAGEKLGFLPGDLQEKVSPYLRPLYDALNDLLEVGKLKMYMERDVIEVIPLAYMRGRTLDRSFIILDEAQNTTRSQMKMVLTRLGRNSTIIVTGDDTQIDLPHREPSGLIHAWNLLQGVPGIAHVRLSKADIVRHRLVQHIVDAYSKEDQGQRPFADATRFHEPGREELRFIEGGAEDDAGARDDDLPDASGREEEFRRETGE